jgi:hypothetical protein
MGMEHAVIMSALGSAASMVQGAQQASAARKQQAATIAHQRQQAALKQRIEERKLERQRRSEEASARARLGASGVGSSGGSGAAVLRGLNADYYQALHDSRTMFNASMDQGPNLLDDGPGIGDIFQMGQQVFDMGQQVFGVLESSGTGGGAMKRRPNGS